MTSSTSLAHERHLRDGVTSLYCQFCGTWPPKEEPLQAAEPRCSHWPGQTSCDWCRWLGEPAPTPEPQP